MPHINYRRGETRRMQRYTFNYRNFSKGDKKLYNRTYRNHCKQHLRKKILDNQIEDYQSPAFKWVADFWSFGKW